MGMVGVRLWSSSAEDGDDEGALHGARQPAVSGAASTAVAAAVTAAPEPADGRSGAWLMGAHRAPRAGRGGAHRAESSSRPGDDQWIKNPRGGRESTAKSAAWVFSALGTRSVVGGLSAFVLARFVGPSVYGVMGIGITYSAITVLLLDQGMGQALIRKKDLRRSDVATMQVTTITVAILAALVTAALAPVLQSFFHMKGLATLLTVLGCGLLFKCVSLPGQAVLQRDGQFRWLAAWDVSGSIVAAAASLGVAYVWPSPLSLAVQILVYDGIYSMGVAIRSGAPLAGANRPALAELVRFTAPVSGSQWLGFVGRNADNVLIGRVLGALPLSYYLLSYRFMMLPIQNLTMVANRVLYPTYARIHEEGARMRSAFLRSCGIMAFCSAPAMALLFVFARPLILGLLGHKWEGAIVPTQVLAIVALVQVQTSLITPAIIALGKAKWQLWWSLGYTILTVTMFAVTVHWGINAVCIGYCAVNLVTFPLPIRIVGKAVGFSLRDFALAVAPGLSVGALVAGLAVAIRMPLEHVEIPQAAVAFGGGAAALALAGVLIVIALPGKVGRLRSLVVSRPVTR